MPRKLSQEHRAKLSIAAKRKRKPLSDDHKTKIALSLSCRPRTQKQIDACRKSMLNIWKTKRNEMLEAQRIGRERAAQEINKN